MKTPHCMFTHPQLMALAPSRHVLSGALGCALGRSETLVDSPGHPWGPPGALLGQMQNRAGAEPSEGRTELRIASQLELAGLGEVELHIVAEALDHFAGPAVLGLQQRVAQDAVVHTAQEHGHQDLGVSGRLSAENKYHRICSASP